MNVLVTGSNGFVGRELVTQLKNLKYNVFEFDLIDKKDILNKEHLKEALNGIDWVFHIAAIVENNNPKLWEINVTGTKNVIEEAAKAKVKKVIFLSTTGVYGKTKKLVNEKSDVKPENSYEKSKVEAEKIILEHQEEIKVCIARSAMVLGPNEYWKKTFQMLRKNYPLPCSGKNMFQIIYVKDLARALITIAQSGENGEIYLVAEKERNTLKNFCLDAKEILGKKRKIRYVPSFIAIIFGKLLKIKILNKENIRHLSKQRKYDIEKIEKIGFKQKYSQKEAINETIEEIKEIDSRQKI